MLWKILLPHKPFLERRTIVCIPEPLIPFLAAREHWIHHILECLFLASVGDEVEKISVIPAPKFHQPADCQVHDFFEAVTVVSSAVIIPILVAVTLIVQSE